MLAQNPSFGRNSRSSPDFVAYPVPKACLWRGLGSWVPWCLGVVHSSLSANTAQTLGYSLTSWLPVTFGRFTCMARAAWVPGQLTLDSPYLYYEDRIVAPDARLNACLHGHHVGLGHTGCNCYVDFFRRCFYSPLTLPELRLRMQFIVDFLVYPACKQSYSIDRGLVFSLPIPSCAHSLLYVDFIHCLPSFGGYHGLIAVTYGLSGFTLAVPYSKKRTGEQTLNIMVKKWFEQYRAPKERHSDEDVGIWSDTG